MTITIAIATLAATMVAMTITVMMTYDIDDSVSAGWRLKGCQEKVT